MLGHKTWVARGQQRVGIGHDDGGGLRAAHLRLQLVQAGQQGRIGRVGFGQGRQRGIGLAAQGANAALQANFHHLFFGVAKQLVHQKRLQVV